MQKVMAVFRAIRAGPVVERLKMIGMGEFVTFEVVGVPPQTALEWWGSDSDADAVLRAIARAGSGPGCDLECMSQPIDGVVNIGSVSD